MSVTKLRVAAACWMGLAAAVSTESRADHEVVTISTGASPLVAVRAIVRAGSQYDPPGKEGLAALTAAMVAQGGTQELTYEQVLEKLYPMAAGLSGNCFKEVAVFSGLVHRDNVKEYERMAADMLTAPRMAKEDFERLKTEALQYLTTVLRGGNDEELGKATLLLALYPSGHPYAHVDEGTVAGLRSITLEDVKAFHKAHYTTESIALGFATSDAGAAERVLVQEVSRLGGPEVKPPALPEPAMPEGLEVVIVEKPSAEATAISIGFPIGVTRSDDDYYALAVANSYLGEHRTFNGKLMQDLRGKRGLNYGDYSYIEDFVQEGGSTFPVPNNPRGQQAFTIWIRPVPHDKAAFALRAALWELDTMVEKGLSAEEFETTRAFLLNYSKLWVQTLERRLGYQMEGASYDKGSVVDELAARLPGLTVESVNAAVRKHLKTPGLRVAIVTNDAKALAAQLQQGAATPIKYDTAGTPEDVLAEDEEISVFPLRAARMRIVRVEEMFEK